MAKKERKGYFYEEQENAVKEYLLTDSQTKRNIIFNNTLLPAFTKMIESIIRRYNLHIPNEEFEETFNDTISFLMSKIEHFEPEKISKKTGKTFKAYSYCGTICKNYLLHKRIEYSKELERSSSYDTMCDEINDDLKYSNYSNNDEISLLNEVINGSIIAIKDVMDGVNVRGVLTEKEKMVGLALINLLENWEDILASNGSNKLNKSEILYHLRETTRLSTKEVRDSMKKYKKAYFNMKEKIMKEL
jgi:hypothetical protein